MNGMWIDVYKNKCSHSYPILVLRGLVTMKYRLDLLKLNFYVFLLHLMGKARSAPEWIHVNSKDVTFRLGSETGPEFRSVGVSLYPFWAGSQPIYPKRLLKYALANGMTSARCILIFEQVNGLEQGMRRPTPLRNCLL
jgi:hypothetical protein